MRGTHKGFTLVELVVVMTVIAILGALGFVSYTGYVAGARDTNRITSIQNLVDLMVLQSTTKKLPMPDSPVNIVANGSANIIGYQGYLGDGVQNALGYADSAIDPLSQDFFTYYVTKDRKSFQILTFMESMASSGLVPTTYAAEYNDRFPQVHGSALGILTETAANGYTPIQDLAITEFDVVSETGTYIAHITNAIKYEGNNSVLRDMIPNASCSRIRELGKVGSSKYYYINPNGAGQTQVECSMESQNPDCVHQGVTCN